MKKILILIGLFLAILPFGSEERQSNYYWVKARVTWYNPLISDGGHHRINHKGESIINEWGCASNQLSYGTWVYIPELNLYQIVHDKIGGNGRRKIRDKYGSILHIDLRTLSKSKRQMLKDDLDIIWVKIIKN
jgi:hypothetical protein